jgi:hypothetical protein
MTEPQETISSIQPESKNLNSKSELEEFQSQLLSIETEFLDNLEYLLSSKDITIDRIEALQEAIKLKKSIILDQLLTYIHQLKSKNV